MRMLIAAVVAALACAVGSVQAQSYSPAAKQVIAQARAASGGAGWADLRGLHETGVRGGVRYDAWFDPIRYGARVETHEPAGLRVHGFNGVADWQILPSGQIIGADDRVTMAQARTHAFLAIHGFYYPSRFGADGEHVGVRQSKGRSFDVLRVQPLGGEPRELWFDRRTHLLTRIVDHTGAKPVTTELSDYRRVGALLIAFKQSSDRGGETLDQQIETISLNPADRAHFSWSLPEKKE